MRVSLDFHIKSEEGITVRREVFIVVADFKGVSDAVKKANIYIKQLKRKLSGNGDIIKVYYEDFDNTDAVNIHQLKLVN